MCQMALGSFPNGQKSSYTSYGMSTLSRLCVCVCGESTFCFVATAKE